MKKVFVGIDISAKTLDFCVNVEGELDSIVIKNSIGAIKKFFKSIDNLEYEIYIGMENTGEYNNFIYQALCDFKHFMVYVVSPLHIKKSMGLTRGKSDKIDAIRITKFIEKNHQELMPWIADSEDVVEMKMLLTERAYMVKNIRAFKQKIKSLKDHKKTKYSNKIVTKYKSLIKTMLKNISDIEKILEQIIKENEELEEHSKLIRSVPGVGKVLTWHLLCKTNGFTQYLEPRKLACCIGIVPFDYSSGTSIHSKKRVSHMADKKLKTIVHMGAMRAVRMDNDLKLYYDRKVKEGKNKMSVLNAIRNKLIHIILAIVKNKTIYKNRLVLS